MLVMIKLITVNLKIAKSPVKASTAKTKSYDKFLKIITILYHVIDTLKRY